MAAPIFNFGSSAQSAFSGHAQPIDPEEKRHLTLFDNVDAHSSSSCTSARLQEIKTAPLFSSHVRSAINCGIVDTGVPEAQRRGLFPQYGLLGIRKETFGGAQVDPVIKPQHDLIYINTNAPWSTFICGSQGGGKSHTLSCMLENALLSKSPAGQLPIPLAGIVFHYDKFTSHSSSQLCEAAYLCSSGVPVRVLVSPSNFWAMEKMYSALPGLPAGCQKPQVLPLYLTENQLNVTNMMTLMAVDDSSGRTPLYLEYLYKTLRDMAVESKGAPGLNYNDFLRRLKAQRFTREQTGPLGLRLQLLEAFMQQEPPPGSLKRTKPDIWKFDQATLTIVDLSCPFVNENDACALFSICLSLFMEGRSKGGRIVALDEAHKFLTQAGEALNFTEQLTSIIRQQRHLATRVVIATQEPTLSPRLLELCNVTIVHRFDSPAWYGVLKTHLAGTSLSGKSNKNALDIFHKIIGLKTGEALLFCSKAMLDTTNNERGNPFSTTSIQELQGAYIKVQIRKRITVDGGRSIMAMEEAQSNKNIPKAVPSSSKTVVKNTPSSSKKVVKNAPSSSKTVVKIAQPSSKTAAKTAPPSSKTVAKTISSSSKKGVKNVQPSSTTSVKTAPTSSTANISKRMATIVAPPEDSEESESESDESESAEQRPLEAVRQKFAKTSLSQSGCH